MALTKIVLSGSSYGAPIQVSATSIGSGTTIHTASNTMSAGLGDEVVLYAANIDSVSHALVLGLGGTSVAYQLDFTIGPNSTQQILPGALLQNSLVIYAAADLTNKINIFGYVIRSA